MALSDSTLSSKLMSLFSAAKSSPMSDKDYADRLASIIDEQIKTADVTVNAGIAVSTSGSPTAQTGSTTSTGTGSLS